MPKLIDNGSPSTGFLEARNQLLNLRLDYPSAAAHFRWPEVTKFNWALDWFDGRLAAGGSANEVALRIVGDNAATCTFGALSRRSNQVANGLRALGIGRGDRILLMLGNCVPLWETMLAAMKLGAVTIPATTLLTSEDLRQRIEQADVTTVVTDAEFASRFAGCSTGVRLIAVGEAPDDWIPFASLDGAIDFEPDGETNADDPVSVRARGVISGVD
ncbi:AMP-binding protein [Sphingobium sp. CFD-2]|uniref:AMP-binding protein n=1 Tax=Sphingobium sp. CFD-2 TaxID=2878542 RepID=UPI00214C1A7C|nr:AMP-binding protein [Sphingobium sp. CFD-2]